jgi:hypothetical protein
MSSRLTVPFEPGRAVQVGIVAGVSQLAGFDTAGSTVSWPAWE